MYSKEERLAQFADLENRPKAGLMDKCVCVSVTLRRPGKVKKVSTNVWVDAEKAAEEDGVLFEGAPQASTEAVALINPRITTDISMLRVSKYVLDCPEMKEIEQHDNRIRRYMLTKALPSIFASGVYLVTIPDVPEVDHTLQTFDTNRRALVNAAVAALPRIKTDAKARLGDLYEEKDYPDEAAFRRMFTMAFAYISYGVNEKLRQISSELFNREQQKAEKKFADAAEQIQAAMRETMAGLVGHAIERLTGKDDGKTKTFKAATITRLQEFLAAFKGRNIADDDQMELLVAQAQALLEGVDPEVLRENTDVRDRLRSGFEDVKKTLDTMIEVQAERRFRFDLDDDIIAVETPDEPVLQDSNQV